MNRIHRLVWNMTRHQWVVAAETARARGSKSVSAQVGALVLAAGMPAGQAFAACADDPFSGASANSGSVCTTTSAAYTGIDNVIVTSGAGTELDASSVTNVNANGSGQAVRVENGSRLQFDSATLNFTCHEEGVYVAGGALNAAGTLTINYAGSSWWPIAIDITDGGSANLQNIDIKVSTIGSGSGEPSTGIGVFGTTVWVGGNTLIDMSRATYKINPGLGLFNGGNATFVGRLDITSPDAAILASGSAPGANLTANGGGLANGSITALNLVGGADGTYSFTNVALVGGRNAIMVGCPAYALGCIDSGAIYSGAGSVTAANVSLNGGSAAGPNVLYVHQPESHIVLNANNAAALNGNVVTATDTVGTNTATSIHLSSGSTLTGAVMGGGGASGNEQGDATQRANLSIDMSSANWILTGTSNLKSLTVGNNSKLDFGTFSSSY
jgi:hypothetical protein